MAEVKCQITIEKPKNTIDLKVYKWEEGKGTITIYGNTKKRCKKLLRKFK